MVNYTLLYDLLKNEQCFASGFFKGEPKVKDGLNDVMTDENKNAEFTCLLSGTPTPDIKWQVHCFLILLLIKIKFKKCFFWK
jgi:hypothetical protein